VRTQGTSIQSVSELGQEAEFLIPLYMSQPFAKAAGLVWDLCTRDLEEYRWKEQEYYLCWDKEADFLMSFLSRLKYVKGLSKIFLQTAACSKRNIVMTFLRLSSAVATVYPHNAPSCRYLYCTHISQPCLKWDTKKESRTCPESVTPN